MNLSYEQIRKTVSAEKGSRIGKYTTAAYFGDFAVCNAANGFFLIDSVIAEQVLHRSWVLDSNGYVKTDVVVNGEKCCVRMHDYVMATKYKDKPKDAIVDHINGCKYDNRYVNLRIVTPAANMRNVRIRSNNTSGICGVAKSKNGKWRAYISFDGKQHTLGVYEEKDNAIAARYCAEEKLGFPHTRDMESYISSLGGKPLFALEMELEEKDG